jgi:ABC-type histidine transport system ATPase subunit
MFMNLGKMLKIMRESNGLTEVLVAQRMRKLGVGPSNDVILIYIKSVEENGRTEAPFDEKSSRIFRTYLSALSLTQSQVSRLREIPVLSSHLREYAPI